MKREQAWNFWQEPFVPWSTLVLPRDVSTGFAVGVIALPQVIIYGWPRLTRRIPASLVATTALAAWLSWAAAQTLALSAGQWGLVTGWSMSCASPPAGPAAGADHRGWLADAAAIRE